MVVRELVLHLKILKLLFKLIDDDLVTIKSDHKAREVYTLQNII